LSRVLVCGYTGKGSCGDEAILDRLISLSGFEITAMTEEPAAVSKAHGINAVGRYDLPATAREMKRSDMLILGGGTLLQSNTSARSLMYYLSVLNTAALFGLPYVIYGGIDDSSFLTGRAVRKATGLFLRDKRSLSLAAGLGAPKEICRYAPDPALILTGEAEGRQRHAGRARATDERYIVCAPRFDDTSAIGAAVAYSKRKETDLVFIAMHPDDRDVCCRVASRFGGSAVLRPDFRSAESVISGAHALFGSRLHACIMAYSHRVPFVAYSHDPKLISFCEDIGMKSALSPGRFLDDIASLLLYFDFSRLEYVRARATLGITGMYALANECQSRRAEAKAAGAGGKLAKRSK